MKFHILSALILFLANVVYGQEEQIIINESISEYKGKSYLISEQLSLTPGFHFTATSGETFSARVINGGARNIPVSSNKNYIRKETILVSGVLTQNQIIDLPIGEKKVLFEYYDGLGRPIQESNVKASPSGKDILQYYEYDGYGRQPKQYLTFTSTSTGGAYLADADQKLTQFYSGVYAVGADNRPYTFSEFEDSPLNRVEYTYGPGQDWFSAGKKTSSKQVINGASEVKLWKVSNNMPVTSAYYAASSLMGVEKIDEDDRVSIEYKDARGLVVLKKAKAGAGIWHETYYVYDDLGNLRFVLPPELSAISGNPSTQNLEDYAFCYEYDDKQRMIKKKLPGAEWEYFIYDRWDRLILSQDGNLRLPPPREPGDPVSSWKFFKYDAFNRVVAEGVMKPKTDPGFEVGVEYSSGHHEVETNSEVGYTLNQTVPVVSTEWIHSVTYYDDYSFLGQSAWNTNGTNFTFVNEPGLNNVKFGSVKGQTTGSKVRNLNAEGWLASVVYYDKNYRNIQSIVENHLGGFDRISNQMDFAGRVLKTRRVHQTDLAGLITLETFEYDHGGRLTKTYHSIDGNTPVLTAENKYNERGELIEKNHYAANGDLLQSEDFRYNVRGWLTSINNSKLNNDAGVTNDDATDLFGMNMSYADVVTINGTATEPRYNGNISAISWNTNNMNDPAQEKIYGYSYDMLERLKSARYATGSNWKADVGGFDVTVAGYDRNGNISGISRNAYANGSVTEIDQLSYEYQGNQLLNVKDHSNNDFGFKDLAGSPATLTEYDYDKNGNMIYDLNRGIVDVSYNYLNLPTAVSLEEGRVINYGYDASGVKLTSQAIVNGSTINKTDYVGGVHYVNGQMAFISMQEGRVVKHGADWDYEYFLKDHLGNIRLTYGATNEIKRYIATMESEKSDKEDAEFIELAPKSIEFNHTASSLENTAPDESLLLQGSSVGGKHMGAGKMLEVSAGDKVSMEVFARYQPESGSVNDVVGAAVGAVTGSFNVTNSTETAAAYESFNNYLQGFVDGINITSEPKAYLTYILFNEDYSGTPQFGWKSMGNSAAVNFEQLLREIEIPYDGYLYIYVANESDYQVFFDDMKIIHQKNNNVLQVTQSNDYYPFGLTFNSYQQEVSHVNKYQFQGQELQTDFDLGWSQFKWRNSDPAIGRFFNVDPLSEKYYYNSTYAFSENRLVDGVELEGLEFVKKFQPYEYTGSWLDYPNAVNNAAIGIVNLPLELWNSGVLNYQALSRGTWTEDVSNEFVQIGDNIVNYTTSEVDYALNTPIDEQAVQGVKNLVSPKTVETVASFGLLGYRPNIGLYNNAANTSTGALGYKPNIGLYDNAAMASSGSLKNISGSLDDAARLARNQHYGPNKNVWRRLPNSTQDEFAMLGAELGAGYKLPLVINDPRYSGWEKWHFSVGLKGDKSVVHYLRNPETGFLTDFKFK